MLKKPAFAIVLAGCGRADGSEIYESTTAMLAIDCAGCTYQCFAPDILQTTVINHHTGEKMSESRNVLTEAARLARGNIRPLSDFRPADFDAVVFPGGLGAVLNWCNFANKGVACSVDTSIERVINTAYQNNLVIGAMCIAPVLIAKVLGRHHICVTVGNDEKTAEVVRQFGATTKVCEATEACVDSTHKIVTTPAYMRASSIKEVYQGAVRMIEEMCKLVQKD